ncbi:MAG: His-Xaa-Ser system radical SAM maturase HxsB [Elusimicrobia bacterium]|nr:His-Xaa-Ser system radical SAM maturase HxsB [Elusimicrobiota bacterium]
MAASGSRLTSPSAVLEREPRRVAGHAVRRLGEGLLVVGDGGEWTTLSEADYRRYAAGDVRDEEPLGAVLAERGLLRDRLDFARLGERFAARRLLRWPGPSVHTLVVTRRCNYKCVYCHASVVAPDDASTDMTPETARAAVDLAFESPNPQMTIEFQGGEPLMNWPVVKFAVDYARLKNRAAGKVLHFGLISNFSLLDEAKADWLIERGVSFCTSLDGPADLHERNRVSLAGGRHADAVAGIRMILAKRAAGAKVDVPNAICTVSRHSLGRAREIVDELVGLGLERVQLGPLDPVGFARRAWDKVGYTPDEYVRFYAQALDHLISLNKDGVKAYEKTALILLIRILEGGHWRFPNADVVARLAYDWDGSVYASEDGRLLAADGDPFFRIGRAGESSLAELLDHPTARASLYASMPECQPMCAQCAYAPFCTISPTFNYETQGAPWGRMPDNAWCGRIMGIFDVLFERLQDPQARAVLESWLEFKDR